MDPIDWPRGGGHRQQVVEGVAEPPGRCPLHRMVPALLQALLAGLTALGKFTALLLQLLDRERLGN